MLEFLLPISIFAYMLATPASASLTPQLDGRIVGGVPTTISTFPWQISIQIAGSHFCGGSIYSEDIIITAAHCLLSQSSSAMKVRAGSSFWNSGGMLVQVASYKIHRRYNPLNMKNDIGIIRLATPLTFKSNIKPIPLATITPEDGTDAVTSGWGTKESGSSTLPTQLNAVPLKIVSLDKCTSDVFGYGTAVRDTMICSYTVDKDACQGDSGGPLVSGGELVGVVSWGYGCAFRNLPGVYSDVAALREWIESTVDAF
ncbi:trypsin alpha-4-like [Eurosta solidaginis]|uniref:trypsin alpha-4-like n=1 Tax=Eurosta solidaginis TaxID=178769 RepID=UPI003530BDE8